MFALRSYTPPLSLHLLVLRRRQMIQRTSPETHRLRGFEVQHLFESEH